jgi:outer membrane lipoprotein-sorting protein
MRARKLLYAVVCLAVVCPVLHRLAVTPAYAEADESRLPEATDALFARMERVAAGVTTISSGFIQEKHLAVFRSVVSSKGRFYFQKPGLLRWETTEPVASGFVLNGYTGRRWHQRTGKEETFDIRRDPVMKIVAEQILAWAKPDFPWLRKEYRVRVLSEEPLSLRLDPRNGQAVGAPDHLRIVLDAEGKHVRTVEIREKDGDSTQIRFVDTLLNRPIPPSLFE